MFKAWHQQPEGSYHADEPRDCVGKYPHSMETAAGSDLAPGEFYTNDGSYPATALITILYAKGRHLWRRPKKKGQCSQIFLRNGEDFIYILKIEIICLPPLTNTIAPIIGNHHIMMRVYLTPPGEDDERWINMTHFDKRTKSALINWIYTSTEAQMWILVDVTQARYLLTPKMYVNKGHITHSEMAMIQNYPNDLNHYF